jgi:hypothetical protein
MHHHHHHPPAPSPPAAAVMAYPALLSPALSAALRHIARRRPALLPVARRAALLVWAGQVEEGHAFSEPGAVAGELARVKGPGDSAAVNGTVLTRRYYTVTLGAGGLYCDCYDFREGYAPRVRGLGPVCEHILAMALAL